MAIDIGPDAIVVLQSTGGERTKVRRAIVHPLPVGLVVDGEVTDADDLAAELRDLFQAHKLPRDVRIGLAHPRLMVRMVELPATLDGHDLESAVHHLAGDLLPVKLDQLVVDYRSVGRAPEGPAGPQQRILMAAARLDGIERLTGAFTRAGLRVQGIQLSGLALLAALDHPPQEGAGVLYVQAGALTNVVITEDDQPVLVRAASTGSEAIAAGIAERTGISHEQARQHAAALGIEPSPPGSPIDPELEATVRQSVREGLRRVAAEVQSSRGFYAANDDARPIGAVVLTGTMMAWPGVEEALREELHLPVLPAGRETWPDLGTVSVAKERLDVVVGVARARDGERPDLRVVRRSGRTNAAAPGRLVAQAACVVVALAALAVVYVVLLSNQVATHKTRIAETKDRVTALEKQSAALKPYDDFANAALQRNATVSSIATTRFNWERALSQLSGVTSHGVWLTSLRGTVAPTTIITGGAGQGSTSGLRGQLPVPAIEIVGCALREQEVPAYMDRLREISGVTDVGFNRSERLDPDAKASGVGTSSSSSADCRNGNDRVPRFEVVVYFKSSGVVPAAGQTATGQAGSSASASGAKAPASGAAPTQTTAAPAPANQTAAVPAAGTP
ncbi:MAG: type pilus assembly protein PilM [Solirubrobacteraceae bacterium]|nr:type pilus assembly protein PilM [Solirubrobacteraceae bacterium]